MRRTSLLLITACLLLIAALTPLAVMATGADRSASAPQQANSTASQTTAGQTGTVNARRLNVRNAPRVLSRAVGSLQRDEQVQIISQQGNWYEIVFPAATGGKGWVNASYITLNSGSQPVAPVPNPTEAANQAGGAGQSPTPGTVAAPTDFAFDGSAFAWKWNSASLMGNQDWYFDIQIFRNNATTPYRVFAIERGNAGGQNGAWRYGLTQSFQPECGSYAVVQIAIRASGSFSGWMSPSSNRVALPCPSSGSQAAPEPTSAPAEPTSEPTSHPLAN